jgi:Zn-dependent protease
MQCSFVKIQYLIGYVGEYMLMQPKATCEATYVCRLFVMILTKSKLLLASANSIPGPVLYIGAQKASILPEYITIHSKYMIT